MRASSDFVTISQLTSDGSRPVESQIIGALFPPLPAYLNGLVQDRHPEAKEQVASVVSALLGWAAKPERVLLVGPIGSGKIAMMHGAAKFAEAYCIRIQVTADMFASDLDRMFAQADQHERVLIIIDHSGSYHSQCRYSHIDSRVAQHLDRLSGRRNTVVVISTNDAANLNKDLQDRFGDFKIDMTPASAI